MYDPKSAQSLELYSSSITLSDMEIFIFPELLYSLVMANIMSPNLWQWRSDPWFRDFPKLTPYRRVLRLKQYIIDHFTFNLDLDTWGLTTKEKELARFSAFIDEAALSQSNALFGYEGDKYYFDIDIRKHFGLDKYTSNVIPYWKTETVEAMAAFAHKPGYASGAGECVSLSTLYAGALFAVAGIPLKQIYLLATPLHSQNFIDINDGIITNNRRIVTKNMWFNGTELSEKARRALQHERVTVVAHQTGHIHTLYPKATISPEVFEAFRGKIHSFLTTDITFEILANFLRQNSKYQKCFQITHSCCGKPRYIEAEKVYSYEHNSKFKASDATRSQLLHEIDEDEFYTEPMDKRLMLDEVEEFFKSNSVSLDSKSTLEKLKGRLDHCCFDVDSVITELITFCRITPKLPEANKAWGPIASAVHSKCGFTGGGRRLSRISARGQYHHGTWPSRRIATCRERPGSLLSRRPWSETRYASRRRNRWTHRQFMRSSPLWPQRRFTTESAWPNPTKSGISAGATVWKRPCVS